MESISGINLTIPASGSAEEKKVLMMYENINFEGIDDDLAAFQEDEMVQQALHRGVDLKKYGGELEKDLRRLETESVAKYVENHPKFTLLYQEMQDCDRVLASMEEMLHGFQADLGEISCEIKHLQEDSMSMSIRLKNRRLVEDKLHAFLEKASISPQVMHHITSPQVNEGFLDAVVILGKRLNYLEQGTAPSDGSCLDLAPVDTGVGRSLLPELERLKIKAVAKIRDYFNNIFASLRKPKTNVHIVQQSQLLRYSGLFHFLNKEATPVADDLRACYVEVMARTVQSLFKSYYTQLVKMEQVVANKADLLVVEDSSLKGIFSQKVDMTKRSDCFALGDRIKVLEGVEREPLLVHLLLAANNNNTSSSTPSNTPNARAASTPNRLTFEEILRSVLKHLIDAATNEFLFVIDFFRSAPKDTFNRIYGKTITMLLDYLENYLLACHDSVGILLMIRMAYLLRLVMQRRRIPVLDPMFDRLSLLLWPRFKQIFDMQVKSLRVAYPSGAAGSGSGAGRGVLASVAVAVGSSPDLSPHYVSRRYAEFISSILCLHGPHFQHNHSSAMLAAASSSSASASAGGSMNLPSPPSGAGGMGGMEMMGIGGGGENMLLQDIALLRQEMIALLERIATSTIPQGFKEQRVFFINNYDAILVVFQERRILSDEVSRFESLLMQQRELFAEEEIRSFFPRLINFVIQTEQQLVNQQHLQQQQQQQQGAAIPLLDEGQVEALIKDFATNWRVGIQQINDDVLKYFANFCNGMEILKQVLTQLLLYYTRFQDLIKRSFGHSRPPSYVREIVSTATILMEIKRYSRTF